MYLISIDLPYMCCTISMNILVYNSNHDLSNFYLWPNKIQTMKLLVWCKFQNQIKHHMLCYNILIIIFCVQHLRCSMPHVNLYKLLVNVSPLIFHHKWGRCFGLNLKMAQRIGRFFIPSRTQAHYEGHQNCCHIDFFLRGSMLEFQPFHYYERFWQCFCILC
jgi:hypothetical protein